MPRVVIIRVRISTSSTMDSGPKTARSWADRGQVQRHRQEGVGRGEPGQHPHEPRPAVAPGAQVRSGQQRQRHHHQDHGRDERRDPTGQRKRPRGLPTLRKGPQGAPATKASWNTTIAIRMAAAARAQKRGTVPGPVAARGDDESPVPFTDFPLRRSVSPYSDQRASVGAHNSAIGDSRSHAAGHVRNRSTVAT